MVDEWALLACCDDLYDSPVARTLLGGTLHPGGLGLTRRLAKALDLNPGARLLDLACGPGASAIMLAQTHKCSVVGIDVRYSAIQRACKEARKYRLDGRASFVVSDGGQIPFADATFDAALSECSFNVFSSVAEVVAEVCRVLRPGGAFLVSDVSYRLRALPPPLNYPIAQALCIPSQSGPERYVQLLGDAGLAVEQQVDCSSAILELVNKVRSGLGVLSFLGKDQGTQLGRQAEDALACVNALVASGDLGYWAFLGRKRRD